MNIRLAILLSAVLSVVFTSGCIDAEQRFKLNPDGSGKVTMRMEVDVRAMARLMQGRPAVAVEKDVKMAIGKEGLMGFVTSMDGIEAWSDMKCEINENENVVIAATGYFPDINALKMLEQQGQTARAADGFCDSLKMTRSPAGATVEMARSPDKLLSEKEALQALGPFRGASGEELDLRAIEEAGELRVLMSMYGNTQAKATRMKTVLEVPGPITAHGSLKKVNGNTAEVSVTFGTLLPIIDELLKDEATMRKWVGRFGSAATGLNFASRTDAKLRDRLMTALWGKEPNLQVSFQVDKPQFDYAAEVAEAKQSPPPLLQEILAKIVEMQQQASGKKQSTPAQPGPKADKNARSDKK